MIANNAELKPVPHLTVSYSPHAMILRSVGNEEPVTTVDLLVVRKAANVLRALNHKLRQQMIALINEKKRITVTELYVQMRLEQSVASQHLAVLRLAGLVKTEREGKYIYYCVDAERINEVGRLSAQLAAF
ncbi:MAG: metalloregulator ArsR/SmtB family transcription factor [Chitinophagaceae bacterium]|nr:metalloregulator ArsR/SmtB family transcription factor [Chitinophagaceae bacterium]